MLALKLADDCDRCELRQGCSGVVWGRGGERVSVVIIGEYPTPEDDLVQEPFSHRAGDYLRMVIGEAGLDFRFACHFTYQVKCLGKTGAEERKACSHWLEKELKHFSPKVVVGLGKLGKAFPEPPSASLVKLRPMSARLAAVGGCLQEHKGRWHGSWYSPQFLLNSGQECYELTKLFFQKVTEKLHVRMG